MYVWILTCNCVQFSSRSLRTTVSKETAAGIVGLHLNGKVRNPTMHDEAWEPWRGAIEREVSKTGAVQLSSEVVQAAYKNAQLKDDSHE